MQKPLKKAKANKAAARKGPAANKHGKGDRVTKRGRRDVRAKHATAAAAEERAVTALVNQRNEGEAARMATAAGARLKTIVPPPPDADAKNRRHGPKPRKNAAPAVAKGAN